MPPTKVYSFPNDAQHYVHYALLQRFSTWFIKWWKAQTIKTTNRKEI